MEDKIIKDCDILNNLNIIDVSSEVSIVCNNIMMNYNYFSILIQKLYGCLRIEGILFLQTDGINKHLLKFNNISHLNSYILRNELNKNLAFKGWVYNKSNGVFDELPCS